MLLSEMLGVERDVDFMVEVVKGGPPVRCRIRQDYEGVEYLERYSQEDGWQVARENRIFKVIHLAPSGIIHLPPPLTDEQREQLKAIWTLGGRWLAKDCDGAVNYYTKIPDKESGYWFYHDDAERYGYAIPLSASVCKLQELNKANEPLDIAKALEVKR